MFNPVSSVVSWITGRGWPSTAYPPALPAGWEAVATGVSSATDSCIVGGRRSLQAIGAPTDDRGLAANTYHRHREDWAAVTFPDLAPAVRAAVAAWAGHQRGEHARRAADAWTWDAAAHAVIVTDAGVDEMALRAHQAATLASYDSAELRDAERAA